MTGGAVVVSAEQIKKAQAHGLINVEGLAAACEHYSFPFYLACTILAKETSGRNIFGHDHGGAMSDPHGKNIEVTEANYREFKKLIGAGHTSNGVGPMQLTWKGYFLGADSIESRGLKPWVPADNMLYGVSILAKSYKHFYELGHSVERAFWETAKSYNGNASYADDAVDRARMWLTIVGNPDTKPQGDDMPITDADLAKIKAAVIAELFTEANRRKLAVAVWQTDGLIASGDPKDPWYKPETFLKLIWGALKKKP